MAIRLIVNTIVCAIFALSANAFAQPQVVVSIKPLHSLVAGVMSGIAEPALIIDGTATPHRYRLKPSQASALSQADLIFWIGPDLETFLRKPIEQLAKSAMSVPLIELDSIEKLDVREEHGVNSHEHHDHGETDPHIWLDPDNAVVMVKAIRDALSTLDTANTKSYTRNAAKLTEKLTMLAKETEMATAAIRGRPFLVFHDSYQYFEKRFGLRSLGAILNRPDVPASAKRISEVRKLLLAQSDATCVFTEPQFNEGLAVAVAPASNSTIEVLDPIGSAVPAGPDHYIKTVVAIRDTLVRCLKPAR